MQLNINFHKDSQTSQQFLDIQQHNSISKTKKIFCRLFRNRLYKLLKYCLHKVISKKILSSNSLYFSSNIQPIKEHNLKREILKSICLLIKHLKIISQWIKKSFQAINLFLKRTFPLLK